SKHFTDNTQEQPIMPGKGRPFPKGSKRQPRRSPQSIRRRAGACASEVTRSHQWLRARQCVVRRPMPPASGETFLTRCSMPKPTPVEHKVLRTLDGELQHVFLEL